MTWCNANGPAPPSALPEGGRHTNLADGLKRVRLLSRQRLLMPVAAHQKVAMGAASRLVVDAKDPKQPDVRYPDIAYDNPAKSRGGTTTIGKMDEQLKPDTFVGLALGGAGSVLARYGVARARFSLC